MAPLDLESPRSAGPIEAELSSLIDERSKLMQDIGSVVERCTSLGRSIKELSGEIQDQRTGLDRIARGLRGVQEERDSLIERIKGLGASLRQEGELHRGLAHSAPRSSIEELRLAIEKAEWRLQAGKLTREEEREVVLRIGELTKNLGRLTKIVGLRQDIDEKRGEITRLKSRLDELGTRAEPMKEELLERRERLGRLLQERERRFEGMARAREDLAELQTRLADLADRIGELKKRRGALLEAEKEMEERAQAEKMEELLKVARREAEEKLNGKRKVTLQEFKLIYGDAEHHR